MANFNLMPKTILPLMNVAINGRDFTGDLLSVIQDMFAFLEAENCAIQIEQDFRDNCQANNVKLPKHTIFSNLHELIDADLAISIGGDGTLLETVSYVRKKGNTNSRNKYGSSGISCNHQKRGYSRIAF